MRLFIIPPLSKRNFRNIQGTEKWMEPLMNNKLLPLEG